MHARDLRTQNCVMVNVSISDSMLTCIFTCLVSLLVPTLLHPHFWLKVPFSLVYATITQTHTQRTSRHDRYRRSKLTPPPLSPPMPSNFGPSPLLSSTTYASPKHKQKQPTKRRQSRPTLPPANKLMMLMLLPSIQRTCSHVLA